MCLLFILSLSFILTWILSGVNLRGDFNTEPVLYDDDADVDADDTLTGMQSTTYIEYILINIIDDQKTFYKLFWSTRKYFSNPPTIFHDNNFEELQKVMSYIVGKGPLLTIMSL